MKMFNLAASLGVCLLVVIAGSTPVVAQGRLPKTVAPIHYAIDLKPDLDKLTITGSEVIDIEVKAPTERLMLNAVRMTFVSAEIDGLGQAAVSFDPGEGI